MISKKVSTGSSLDTIQMLHKNKTFVNVKRSSESNSFY